MRSGKPGQRGSFAYLFPPPYLPSTQTMEDWLDSDWDVTGLESIISGSSSACSALWALEHLDTSMRPFGINPRSEVRRCCGSIHFEGLEQAELTEILIVNGPKWVARVLLSGTLVENSEWWPRNWPTHMKSLDIIKQIPLEHNARTIARGLARMLWRHRTEKIGRQQEQRRRETSNKAAITDMRVSAAVWRGSSGDM